MYPLPQAHRSSRWRRPVRLQVEPLEDRSLPSAGGLDFSFAGFGQRTIPLPAGYGNNSATAVTIQRDGKIVLAGPYSNPGGSAFSVTRLNTDGTLDSTFGSGGTRTFQFPQATFHFVQSVMIEATTQQIVVVGAATEIQGTLGANLTWAVARLNPDGSFDTSLNGTGMQQIQVAFSPAHGVTNSGAVLAGAALEPDQQIVLAGYTYSTFPFSGQLASEDLLLYRLNTDGSLDTSFNGDGKLTLDLGGLDISGAVAVQGDKIVVAGASGVSSAATQTDQFAVIRLTPSGQLDSTFNGSGKQIFGFGSNQESRATSLAVGPGGKIVVGGSTQPTRGTGVNSDFAIARLNADGTLDTTFNGTGTQTVAFDLGGSDADDVRAVAVQADGKVLAAGRAVTSTVNPPGGGSASSSEFAVARLNADGTPDASFGTAGRTHFAFNVGGDHADEASAMALQVNGRIVVAGKANTGGSEVTGTDTYQMAVARLLASNAPPKISTVGVFDPGFATWYLHNFNLPGAPDIAPFAYGGTGWIPVVGDWDGDGTTTIGVFDPATATWYLKNSNGPGAPDIAPFPYGGAGWTPVVGDWDGDGKTTVGVVDPQGRWYLRNSNSAGFYDANPPEIGAFAYGAPSWTPVVGDWDGDGQTTIGTFDPSTATFYLKNRNTGGGPDITPFAFGGAGWKPVSGDWRFSGQTSVGVFDPSGQWYLRNAAAPGAPDVGPFAYGLGSWVPVAGDWNFPAFPLRAAGGEGSRSAAPLSAAALHDTVSAALTRLRGAGIGSALLARLTAADVEPGPLPAGYLGLAYPGQNRVVISHDGAGYGWFVDPTPLQDEEFVAGTAPAGSPAAGGMDLLTAVLHELGHLAGQADTDGAGLMGATLTPGTREANALGGVFGPG
jgi:uncharacterized delta-60 repeat protein